MDGVWWKMKCHVDENSININHIYLSNMDNITVKNSCCMCPSSPAESLQTIKFAYSRYLLPITGRRRQH